MSDQEQQEQQRNRVEPGTIEAVSVNLWSIGDDFTQEDMTQVGDLLARLMNTTAEYMIDTAGGRADPSILTMAAVNYMVATLDRIWRGIVERMAQHGVDRSQYFTVLRMDVAQLMLETARGRPMVMTLEEMAALKAKLSHAKQQEPEDATPS